MTFETILPELKNHRKAVRRAWRSGEKFVKIIIPHQLEDEKMTPYFVIKVAGEGYSMYQPTVCDILATDWLLVD